MWKKYLALRNQQLKTYLLNPAYLDHMEFQQSYTTEENISADCISLLRVSHVLNMMFEEDYNIISLSMFPEAGRMLSEEVDVQLIAY